MEGVRFGLQFNKNNVIQRFFLHFIVSFNMFVNPKLFKNMRLSLNLLLVLAILFSSNMIAQVGIGTTNPDPSALLELESNSQGLLTTRLTSAERSSISNPADGLLVYDTDDSAFYYYSSGAWTMLDSATKRDNYKLVKSVADLSEELTAGGGTKYLLSSNYLYEINGTVSVDYPIELNGAYVKGEDNVEDRLLNATGGTLFTGNTGGNLKRMTILGNGQQVFDITGTGSENLVCLAVNFIGASSMGNLSTLNLVFFNTGQFVSNSNGLTVNDINSYFMTLFTWTSTNTGTFLTLNGTFSEIQLTNANVNVSSGTGINVSSNPVVSSGTLFNVAFSGAGTYINRYTSGSYNGYDFSNNWFVNCPGLVLETDWVAAGNFYYNGNLTTGFVQTISNGTAVEVQGNGTFTSNNLFRFTVGGSGNRLTYDGLKTREFQVSASMSVRVTNAPGNFYAFIIAKNGSVVTESNAIAYIDSDTQIQNISLNANVSLANGDYVEIFVQRLTGSGNDTLVVFSENLSIK